MFIWYITSLKDQFLFPSHLPRDSFSAINFPPSSFRIKFHNFGKRSVNQRTRTGAFICSGPVKIWNCAVVKGPRWVVAPICSVPAPILSNIRGWIDFRRRWRQRLRKYRRGDFYCPGPPLLSAASFFRAPCGPLTNFRASCRDRFVWYTKKDFRGEGINSSVGFLEKTVHSNK